MAKLLCSLFLAGFVFTTNALPEQEETFHFHSPFGFLPSILNYHEWVSKFTSILNPVNWISKISSFFNPFNWISKVTGLLNRTNIVSKIVNWIPGFGIFRWPLDFQPNLCPQLDIETEAFPQYNPNIGSIFSNEPSVVIFKKTLKQAVYNTDILREVFDLSQSTALEYSKFIYKYNLDLLKSLGFKKGYASATAEFAARALGKYPDVLTMPLMMRTLGNTAAYFLFVHGDLTTDKAEDLALTYAEIINKEAQANLTSDPSSKFKIIADSFFNFLFAVNDKAMDTAPLIQYYMGNEWFQEGVNSKWSNHF